MVLAELKKMEGKGQRRGGGGGRVARGALLDTQNYAGLTAVMWAAEYGHTAICGMLLNVGASEDILDKVFIW